MKFSTFLIAYLFLFNQSNAQLIGKQNFKLNTQSSKSNILITIPTITKYNYWDNAINNWVKVSSEQTLYNNNNIVEEFHMDYDHIDTSQSWTYSYDNLNRVSSIIEKNKDIFTGKLKPYLRSNFTNSITPKGVQTITISEIFDKTANAWINNARITKIVNPKGYTIFNQEEFFRNGSWEIQLGTSRAITYLNQQSFKITLKIDSIYDAGQYVPSTKEVRDYNAYEDLSVVTNFEYSNNWVPIDRYSLIYSNRLPIQYSEFGYDDNSSSFIETYRNDSIKWVTYDQNTSIFIQIPLSFNALLVNNGTLQYTERVENDFVDNYGSLVSYHYYNSGSSWDLSHKFVWLNDTHLNAIENTTYNYINTSWEIYEGLKAIHTYVNNNLSQSINTLFDQINNTFNNDSKEEYFDFINITQGFNTYVNTLDVKLFPNPSANGNVNINLNLEKASNISISVMDINGRIVSSQEVNLGSGLNTVQLSNLNSGLYFVEIVSDYGVSKTKLLVK